MQDILPPEYREFKGSQRSTQIIQDYFNKMVNLHKHFNRTSKRTGVLHSYT